MTTKAEAVLEKARKLHAADPTATGEPFLTILRYPDAWRQTAELLNDRVEWALSCISAGLSRTEVSSVAAFIDSELVGLPAQAISRPGAIGTVLQDRALSERAICERAREGMLKRHRFVVTVASDGETVDASSYGVGVPLRSSVSPAGVVEHSYYEDESFVSAPSWRAMALDRDDLRMAQARRFEENLQEIRAFAAVIKYAKAAESRAARFARSGTAQARG